jgi:hypothetical protein
MSVVNSSSIIIKNADNEAFNLGSVTQSPRTATVSDLEAACSNVILEKLDKSVPDNAVDAARFVLTDYFTQAHQSGLLNRQLPLWELISKIVAIDVKAQETGFFQKSVLPVYDLNFKTASGQISIMGLLIEPAFKGEALDQVKDFLGRLAKQQARSNYQTKGIFIFCASPFPQTVLAYIEKATNATDAIARFESILSAPYQVHANLVVKLSDREEGDELVMVHPQLRKAKRAGADKQSENSAQIIYKSE